MIQDLLRPQKVCRELMQIVDAAAKTVRNLRMLGGCRLGVSGNTSGLSETPAGDFAVSFHYWIESGVHAIVAPAR